MAITVKNTPLKVSLSGNRVPVKLHTDLTGSEKQFLTIHLKVQYWNGTKWITVGHDAVAVDSNNEAEYYIEDYLKLQTIPDFEYPATSMLISRPTMLFRYRLAYYESYFDANNSTYTTTSEVQNTTDYYSLDGGIDEDTIAEYNKDNTNWLEVLTNDKLFLTWQPIAKQTHIGATEKLFWLNQTASRIKLKVKRTNADDSTNETIPEELSVSSYQVIECSISPKLLFSDTSSLKKYEIWLLDENDNIISEVRTYNIDRTYYERNDTFLFLNSFGAFDTIWSRGNITEQVDHKRTSFTKSLENNFNEKQHQEASSRSLKRRSGEGELGYINEADPLQWKEYYAMEFLGGKYHYKLYENRILPVKITTEESLLYQDDQGIYSQPFKWKQSRSNTYYGGYKRKKDTGETHDYLLNESGEIITNESGEGIWV
jgi:hypothetical protein